MKPNLKKIFPVLLLTLVVFAGVGWTNKTGASDPYNYNHEYAYSPNDTIQQINDNIGLIDHDLGIINNGILTSQERNPEFYLEPKTKLLADKLELMMKKQDLDLPSPDNVTNQNLTDVQNQLDEAEGKLVSLEQTKDEAEKARAAAAKAAEDRGECWAGVTGGFFNVGNCLTAAFSWAGAILVFFFTRITWFANELFNQSINISVRTFSSYANMPSVKVAWSVIRDLVNMGFIFVLLYIAISTILGVGANDWKKLVPKLIIVALLVNFSMFFTRVVIDISNVTANQFYTSAAQGTTSSRTSAGVTFTGAPDVTTALFKNIKVFSTNWLTAKSIGEETDLSIKSVMAGGVLTWRQVLVGTFGAVALALVAAFVLFTGAVLFIIRTLRLLFLIILSPFAFFFLILPKTASYAGKWFKALMDDATFAPAFLIMIYAVTKITQEIGGAGKTDDGSVIFFLLIMGLLLGAIIVAKALGAAGAKGAEKFVRSAGNLAGGFLGRNTVGRLAYRAGTSERMGKMMAGSPRIGGTLKKIADYGARAGFGSKKGFEKTIKEKAKTVETLKKFPELQTKYIASLGKGVPLIGNLPVIRNIPLLGGDKLIQQAAYEKLSVKDRVKFEREIPKLKERELKREVEQALSGGKPINLEQRRVEIGKKYDKQLADLREIEKTLPESEREKMDKERTKQGKGDTRSKEIEDLKKKGKEESLSSNEESRLARLVLEEERQRDKDDLEERLGKVESATKKEGGDEGEGKEKKPEKEE
jgi:hypothetical protein